MKDSGAVSPQPPVKVKRNDFWSKGRVKQKKFMGQFYFKALLLEACSTLFFSIAKNSLLVKGLGDSDALSPHPPVKVKRFGYRRGMKKWTFLAGGLTF